MMAERVQLRSPVEGDRDAFLEAMRLSRDLHDPWVHPPLTPLEFSIYLARVSRPDNPGFLVCRVEDGAIAGVINFNHIVHGGIDSAHLGYYGVAGQGGQGLMTEGMELAMEYGFLKLALHRLEANIQPANQRSIALARRCGFRYEGFSPRFMRIGLHWCDHERWAITIEEWRSRRRRVPR